MMLRDLVFVTAFGLAVIWFTRDARAASPRLVRCEVVEVSTRNFTLDCDGQRATFDNSELHPAFRRVGVAVVFTPSPEFNKMRGGLRRRKEQ